MIVEEIFERLAQGHSARLTVVTPNRRLAQFLRRDFDLWQIGRGLKHWETADVLPFGAFVQRLWEDALFGEGVADAPLLLTPAQEQALWEDTIYESRRAEALLSAAAAASECREAWQLAHAWRLLPEVAGARCASAFNEDSQAFIEWSARYAHVTAERGLTDTARLPEVVVPLLAHKAVRKPATLVLFGFDSVTPQQQAFIDELGRYGVEVFTSQASRYAAKAHRLEFGSQKEEILAVARWARARLEKGAVRIGIVIPDLAQSRNLVQRTLACVLQPENLLPGPEKPVLPFNISLGLSLARHPLVHDGLLVLQLTGRELAFNDVSRLLRSPFIAGADTEMAARARLDAAIRERAGAVLTIDELLRLFAMKDAPAAPILLERLSQLARRRKVDPAGSRTAPEWAKAFSEILAEVGFPGERKLDSNEYQTLQKWHELLTSFATLERVTGKMSHAQAWQRLRRMAADTVFQPETPDVPIQVLGVFESAGLTFDHLWVVGLTDEAWPLSPRPNPFLPIRLQREAGIPQADAASSLERDRQITAGWLTAAAEVIVSHARMKEDSEFAPSPLIAALEKVDIDDLAVPTYDTLRHAIHRAYRIEKIEDGHGPPLSSPLLAAEPSSTPLSAGIREVFSGGTAIFKDQAACPFRAFARYRLFSESPDTPEPGLDAADRGTLLHHMLAVVWEALGGKAQLEVITDADLAAVLSRCADDALARLRYFKPDAMDTRFAEIEKARLIAVTRQWLEFERSRPDFAVVATERKQTVTFGGLTVNAKLDRMDRLGTGGHAVIDYKTGACAVSAWLGPRPDEPQLPMYALSAGEEISAVVFAQVKTGDLRFKGLANAEGLLPGANLITKDRSKLAKSYTNWPTLLEAWRLELEELGHGFVSGDARVDPKHGGQTCRQCDQHLFCRIAERSPFLAADGREENGDDR